jgi:hypothetical protein
LIILYNLSMSWMSEHKRIWRVVVLVLLLAAISGPWAFDRINVPAQYPCSNPYIRLDGDFCGIPLSGIWILSALTSALERIVWGIVLEPLRGYGVLTDRDREFLIGLLGLLFVLPIFSTLLLILRDDRRWRLVFHVVALGMVVGLGFLFCMSYPLKLLWVLWGPWLYVGVAASALVLEVAMLAVQRRTVHG